MILRAADAAAVEALVRAVGRTQVMPRFRRLDAGDVRMKSGPLDLVTAADVAAEHALTEGLLALFPGAVVVGEEAASADPGVLGRLADAELALIVDPIDGTANFAAGLPLFGIMVAAVVRGEVALACIHDPVGDDTALALRGEGAWIWGSDGTRTDLHVAAPAEPARMAGTVAWRMLPPQVRRIVCANLDRVAASFGYRCAAHEYRMLAGGHCHFSLYGRLLPWDHAAGWLLHREAGGWSAMLDGAAYLPVPSMAGLLCAPDRDAWRALREALLAEHRTEG